MSQDTQNINKRNELKQSHRLSALLKANGIYLYGGALNGNIFEQTELPKWNEMKRKLLCMQRHKRNRLQCSAAGIYLYSMSCITFPITVCAHM